MRTAGETASAGPMLTPCRRRGSEWYYVPPEWVHEVAPAPCIHLDHGRIVAHLNHLPLLVPRHPEVQSILDARRPSHSLSDREKFDETTDKLGWKLRPYQHTGREFIRSRRGTLLADGLRTGKTASAVSSHDDGPLLVVAPLITREVWLTWMRRRYPDRHVRILLGRGRKKTSHGTIADRLTATGYEVVTDIDNFTVRDDDLLFTHYDVLPAWRNVAARIGLLVYDEAHVLSNYRSQRAESAVILTSRADRVICATGTPMWNRPKGLWTLLGLINPGAWGSRYEFMQRYCDGRPGTHGYVADGASNEAELRLRLSQVMIRRTWEDVAPELPGIERTIETVDITERQAYQVYRQAQRVRSSTKRSTVVGELARFRRLLARLKTETAINSALEIVESGERVVVWTWHRDVADEIAQAISKKGATAYTVTGATSQRDIILDLWRNGGAAALVITLSIGQAGIDLSAARQAVFAEIDFTPAVIAQAEMRVFSPLRPCAVNYIIIDHPIERQLIESIRTKSALADRAGVPASETTLSILSRTFDAEEGDLERLAAAAMAADIGDQPDDVRSDNWLSDGEDES